MKHGSFCMSAVGKASMLAKRKGEDADDEDVMSSLHRSARRCARARLVVPGQVAPEVFPDQPEEFGGDVAWFGTARQPLGEWVGNAVVGLGAQKS